MLRVFCDGCKTSAYVDCVCPIRGHDPGGAGFHLPSCGFADLGANVACPPDSGCCDGSAHPGASHDRAANSCPGIPDGAHTCAIGNTDCTVCRTVTIEVMPGSVQVVPAIGA